MGSQQIPTTDDYIECPLCHGDGQLVRTEATNRLLGKDLSRVAELSVDEAFRRFSATRKSDEDALWIRFEGEVHRRTSALESKNIQLEERLDLAETRQLLEIEKATTELKRKLDAQQSQNDELGRQLNEQRKNNEGLANEKRQLEDKYSRAGRREEVDFAEDVSSWPGICISEKLSKNGDYTIAYRDLSGSPVGPKILVDNKDRQIKEDDLTKIVRDAKERGLSVAAIVVGKEADLRPTDIDKNNRFACRDDVWLLRTARPWLRRDLDVARPLLERMRTEGADFLRKNAALG